MIKFKKELPIKTKLYMTYEWYIGQHIKFIKVKLYLLILKYKELYEHSEKESS
jgi:hypothetical protein